ncbi:hypothetical protein ABK040_003400 [Willaertia magna]
MTVVNNNNKQMNNRKPLLFNYVLLITLLLFISSSLVNGKQDVNNFVKHHQEDDNGNLLIKAEVPTTNTFIPSRSIISYSIGLRGIITRNLTTIFQQPSDSLKSEGSSSTSSTSDKHASNPLCVENIKESSLHLIILFLCLSVSIGIMYLLHRFHVTWFPESIGVLLFGVLIGVAARYIAPSSIGIEVVTQLDPAIFFSLFLPAIIFDAGYTLDQKGFFGNIGGIILYAVAGTVISSVIVACGLYILGYYGLSIQLGLVECFMFGALISAVDPVATLAIFCALGVPTTLHYLVFGESIVNDAVAIVLYETFEQFREVHSQDDLIIVSLKGLGQFIYVSLGSVLVSIIFCAVSALLFKFVNLRHTPKLEMAVFFLFAYLSYLSSLPFLSGIMTILASGILMSHYTRPNLSEQTATAISAVSGVISMISETFTFLYVGFGLFSYSNNEWDFRFIGWTILLCLIGRFFNIVPLTGILNCYRREKISFKYQLIMWFSGLRGAIAFALALGLRAELLGGYIFTCTLGTVFFTILVLGGGTFPLLKILRIKKEPQSLPEVPQQQQPPKNHWLVNLDRKYLQKWFLRKDVREQLLKEEEEAIKRAEELEKEKLEEQARHSASFSSLPLMTEVELKDIHSINNDDEQQQNHQQSVDNSQV